jgi:hypothetical protein
MRETTEIFSCLLFYRFSSPVIFPSQKAAAIPTCSGKNRNKSEKQERITKINKLKSINCTFQITAVNDDDCRMEKPCGKRSARRGREGMIINSNDFSD